MADELSFRDRVLRSLSAVGAIDEARFYADLFAAQDPAQFALIVLDPRCLKNPLLEALISNIRILTDLGLYPVLLVGALDNDRTSVRFQSQRLAKELEAASVKTAKLNTATYQLIPDVRAKAASGRLPILELTEPGERHGLKALAAELKPAKIIFLQPSGGISIKGRRVAVINIDAPMPLFGTDALTSGQARFMALAQDMASRFDHKSVYVIASPLNLLAELFTTKGSGTLIRRGAKIDVINSLAECDTDRLLPSINAAFKKSLRTEFLSRPIFKGYIETEYRGGAVLTTLASHPYLSKFWVTAAAQGEGLARDIWERMLSDVPALFWRSRRDNPFNDWYMRQCEGMQVSGDWRIFWIGLKAAEIADAVTAGSSAQDDFLE